MCMQPPLRCFMCSLIGPGQSTSAPFLTCSQVISAWGGESLCDRCPQDLMIRKIGILDWRLTLFDELYENRVVPTDGQPKAVLIFLNDHTSLNQPWREGENKRESIIRRELRNWFYWTVNVFIKVFTRRGLSKQITVTITPIPDRNDSASKCRQS